MAAMVSGELGRPDINMFKLVYIYIYMYTHTLTWVLSVAPRKTEAYFTSVLNVCLYISTCIHVSMFDLLGLQKSP